MQSKTSCFNKTLFRKNLTRFWPLWGMASFGGSLFPLAMLLNLAVAYGWHYAKEGESLLRSEGVKGKILSFVDKNEKTLISEKAERKKAIGLGYEALNGAVERASLRLKMQRAMKVKS